MKINKMDKEEERPASKNRFEEMYSVLQNDCKSYCENINKTINEINDLIR